MTLPSFVGIGVPKAGTTWLYELLVNHPEVYIPTKVKDIRYFNRFYDRGAGWYEGFFPSGDEAAGYKVIGEITAHYLYSAESPQRMARDLEQPKLILMLRHPVDRAWSNYKHTARLKNYQHSFEDFLEDYPEGIRFSMYSDHLKRYQDCFDSDQLMVLIYERVFSDVRTSRSNIADFLEIDSDAFADDAGMKVVNKGYIPRNRSVYAMIARGAWLARNNRIYWPVQLAKKLGVKQLISVEGVQPERMSDDTRQELLALFDQDISETERLLQTDLNIWRT